MAELLLGVPWFIWSFAIVYWVGTVAGQVGAWIIVAAWLASGALTFWRPAEGVIAKVLFRLRRPTMRERQRLDPTWAAVTNTAGIDGSKYELWVEDTADVSAAAAAGHTVAVTSWAITTLPPRHLAAVLAHELAHHLGGHSWASTLSMWYSVPARLVLRLIRAIVKLLVAVPFLGCLVVGFLFVGYFGVFFMIIVFQRDIYSPLLLLTPFVVPPILAWFSRAGEKYADRTAAKLGHGPVLLDVFYGWQSQGHDATRRAAGRKAGVLAGHPSAADRIRALEKYMAQEKAH